MQLGEISFCDKIGYNIKHDVYKETILQDLEANYGFKVVQRHHENFDQNSQATQRRIRTIPHMVSTKTNGNPYLLYLTKYNFSNQCIFIDKKIQHGYFHPRMICVKLWFQDKLFENTLFDGEMVKDKDNKWTYIINDIIAKENNPLRSLKLIQRINIVYSTLRESYYNDSTACCTLCVKRYFKVEEIPYIVNEFIPKLNYTCRGLYFKPIYSNFKDLLYNFNPLLIKSVTRLKYTDLTKTSFLSKQNINLHQSDPRKKNIQKKDDSNKTKQDDHQHNQHIDQPIRATNQVSLPPHLNPHSHSSHLISDHVSQQYTQDPKLHPICTAQNSTQTCTQQCTQQPAILPSSSSSSSSSSSILPNPLCQKLKSGQRVFSVKKTKLPDVYDMQQITPSNEQTPTSSEIACVQDRKTSCMMRSIFNNLTFLEKVEMVCEYNDRFKKWQPIFPVEKISC